MPKEPKERLHFSSRLRTLFADKEPSVVSGPFSRSEELVRTGNFFWCPFGSFNVSAFAVYNRFNARFSTSDKTVCRRATS